MDYIAEKELRLKKLEYIEKGMTLDDFFIQNPIESTLYNIVDVVLIVGLGRKLQFFDLHNQIRRAMHTPLQMSIIGSSALYDSFIFSQLDKDNKKIRCNIVTESSISFPIEYTSAFGPIRGTLKKPLNPIKIGAKDFLSITKKYPGAYVKQPYPEIIADQTMIIDMDASLPPWEKILIKRNNKISYITIESYQFQKGDLTLTWNENNETCWEPVLGKIDHDWDNELIEIITETGKKATVTTNHSVFGIKSNIKTNQISKIDAHKLTTDDYIYCYKSFDPETNGKLEHPEVVGFWLSDGWRGSKNNYYIAKQDINELQKYSPVIDNIHIKRLDDGIHKTEYVGKCTNSNELYPFTTDTKLKNFLEILNYNKEDRIKIWKGMYDADGHDKIGDDCQTPNQLLCKYRDSECDECFIVAHTIGWKPKREKNGVMNSVWKSSNMSTYGPDNVCPEIFGYHKGYTTKLKIVNLSSNHRHHISKLINVFPHIAKIYTKTMGLEKIRSIKRIKYTGKVYDISVENTERFFAGTGLGVSNTSMYPSNIKQGNISFDTYVARVIPPQCYSTINVLKNCLGKTQFPNALVSNIQKYVIDYVENKGTDNKSESIQKFYYTTLSLFRKLSESNKTFEEISIPQTDETILLLKNILIPLLDTIFTIHPKSEIYNTFVYDYVYYDMTNYQNTFENKESIKTKYNNQVWVILNPNECNTQLVSMTIDEIYDFIQKYSICFSGCMFLKHNIKKGLFIDILTDFAALRKSHKKLRDTYEKGTQLYKFEDNNQNVFKRLMNTCYGLYGLSTFRYSDNWLARSITNNSLHALKCAIYKGEEYLNNFIKD